MTSARRSRFKRLAERGLVAARIPAVLRALRPAAGAILTYHNVVPDGEPPGGDRSLHLARDEFARHLDVLRRSHRIVPLTTLLERPKVDERPLAAITFDDGYRGALTVGLRELAIRGLPCTVFVAPGLLGSSSLWWDALADPEEGRVPRSVRERALIEARGGEQQVRRWAASRGLSLRSQPPHASIVDEEFLASVVSEADVWIGSHGWGHANLVRLQGEELREEVRRPLVWLRERFRAAVVPWLSLPYGHGSSRVTTAALDAGYEGVLSLSGQRVKSDSGVETVPRVNVPAGSSPEGILLRAAGM